MKDGLLLKYYFYMKSLGLSDERAFGIDKSDAITEEIPLIYQPINVNNLNREF
jgi:KUP system potassium uptake protein